MLTRQDDPLSPGRCCARCAAARSRASRVGQVLGITDVVAAADALPHGADVALAGALRIAEYEARALARAARSPGCRSSRWAASAGGEMGYGSDADVLFVHDPLPGVDEPQAQVAGVCRSPPGCGPCSARSATEPPLEVDADLRPEGRNGPLVRTLASYAEYYAALVVAVGGPGAAAWPAGGR